MELQMKVEFDEKQILGLAAAMVKQAGNRADDFSKADKWLTMSQACKLLRVGTEKFNAWRAEGLPVQHWGGNSFRVDKDELAKWLAENKTV